MKTLKDYDAACTAARARYEQARKLYQRNSNAAMADRLGTQLDAARAALYDAAELRHRAWEASMAAR